MKDTKLVGLQEKMNCAVIDFTLQTLQVATHQQRYRYRKEAEVLVIDFLATHQQRNILDAFAIECKEMRKFNSKVIDCFGLCTSCRVL